MAITTAMCNSFKGEILAEGHDLANDSLKVALIKSGESGTYGAATTNYSNITDNSDEASGTGYSAGGQVLDSVTVTTNQTGNRAFVDIENETFSTVTVSTAGCLIYNATNGNRAIAVISFGGTVSATAGDLTIEFPGTGTNGDAAIIRIE
jgi:hypothetical protein